MSITVSSAQSLTAPKPFRRASSLPMTRQAAVQADTFTSGVRFGAQASGITLLPDPVIYNTLQYTPFAEALQYAAEKAALAGEPLVSTEHFIAGFLYPALDAAKNLPFLGQETPPPHITPYLHHLQALFPPDMEVWELPSFELQDIIQKAIQGLQEESLAAEPPVNGETEAPQAASKPVPKKATVPPKAPATGFRKFIEALLAPFVRFFQWLTAPSSLTAKPNRGSHGPVVTPNGQLSPNLRRLLSGFIQSDVSRNRTTVNFLEYLDKTAAQPDAPAEYQRFVDTFMNLQTDLIEACDDIGDEIDSGGAWGRGDHQKIHAQVQKLHKQGGIAKDQLDVILGYLEKLKGNPMSTEVDSYQAVLGETLKLPWKGVKGKAKVTNASIQDDLKQLKINLDHEIYGMPQVKAQILDYMANELDRRLAFQSGNISKELYENSTRPLLIVGPPGIGKTAFGKAVAKAMKRPFEKISLGGVHEEPQIRGHRLTYIGAGPGRIMEAFKRAKQNDPVLLFDEIDKLGKGGPHGDPSAALLEVFDPRQNTRFEDHYLGFGFDISNALMIATANSLSTIDPALKDRFHIIDLREEGYTTTDKIDIASRFTIPSIQKRPGLEQFQITPEALRLLAEHYAPSRGYRGMEKRIEQVANRLNRNRLEQQEAGKAFVLPTITNANLTQYLQDMPIPVDPVAESYAPGQFSGLYYSESTVPGGIIPLYVTLTGKYEAKSPREAGLLIEGKTGGMQPVMKESIDNARAYILSDVVGKNRLGLQELLSKNMVKMNIQAGDSGKKEGPSAGAAMAISMISALTGKATPSRTAMTGELNSDGSIAAIGGLKWKLIGAKRQGIQTVYIPKANLPDYERLSDEVKQGITVIPVAHMDDVTASMGLTASA